MRWILAVVATVILGFLVFAAYGEAAPYVVCDPYTGNIPSYFKVTLDGGTAVNSPTYTGNILHYDVGTVTIGTHAMTVAACKAGDAFNPEVCSTATPFSFTRGAAPAVPSVPSGISLSQQ